MLMKIVMKLLLNISTLEFQDMDFLGTFVSKKKFNPEGDLFEKSIHKYSAWVKDGFMKIHQKTITYSKKGTRKSVHLKISKGKGRGGSKSILDKIILFDDNGKVIKTINNLER